jgi:glycosyltransferase involved in cell wall biosynthesis
MVAQVGVGPSSQTCKEALTKVIACTSPYGKGGLGRHFAEIIEEARSENRLARYYSRYRNDSDEASLALPQKITPWLPYTPFRYSPGWLNHLENEFFDRAVAKALQPAGEFEGFGGQTLHSFRRARQLGYQHLSMQAANSHVSNVKRQHEKALRQWPFETSWLNTAQHHKTLKEYEMADTIYVASEYTRQSFLNEGVPDGRLRKRLFKPNPRFTPSPTHDDDGIFRVVYTGSLTVAKGIPVLVEAFSRLTDASAELILVGGWATRGMRRYLKSWMAKDQRIQVAPGDPLPHLHQASVYVHPSFEDGFAYAPMEALACNVPVIVTEDTGMKDYVRDGSNGYIVPTGNIDALYERLVVCNQSPLLGGLL